MTQALPPSQEEVERAQRDLFQSGDMKAVARYLDVDPSHISRTLNPEEPEHKSALYAAVRWLWACDQVREGLGDGHLTLISKLRNGYLGKRTNGDPVRLHQAVSTSLYGYIQATMSDLPITERMAYLADAKRTIEKFENGLMFDDHDSPAQNRLRSVGSAPG